MAICLLSGNLVYVTKFWYIVEKKNLANRIAAGEKTRFLRLIF
jgi:uncharacterized protein YhbP (UPF0306 family)